MAGRGTQPVIDFRFRRRSRKGQELRVVEIVYIPTQDADLRMGKALDILLNRPEAVQARGLNGEEESSGKGNG